MLESLGALGGYGITSIIIILIAFFFFVHAVKKVVGNIICGGILFYLLNTLGITHITWTFTNGLIVALLGTPGTILLAIRDLFF
ncbi:ABC transporter permease [uncultured Dialister sp.]|uniref:ABC transporter permease n=1 Tax=uncultured Dialister sp. TaxID=278064 RepID=UPI0025F02050|nr:ABC transporter permease [uncultured Dialister sp.]